MALLKNLQVTTCRLQYGTLINIWVRVPHRDASGLLDTSELQLLLRHTFMTTGGVL